MHNYNDDHGRRQPATVNRLLEEIRRRWHSLEKHRRPPLEAHSLALLAGERALPLLPELVDALQKPKVRAWIQDPAPGRRRVRRLACDLVEVAAYYPELLRQLIHPNGRRGGGSE